MQSQETGYEHILPKIIFVAKSLQNGEFWCLSPILKV